MTQPSWSQLQRERARDAEVQEPPFEDITKVLERIGETPDGQLLRKWLHDTVLMRQAPRGTADSALREIVAEKRFAHRLHELLEPHSAATDRPKRPARNRRDTSAGARGR